MILVDALTLALKDMGVRYIFGVSGANIEHLHDAIYRLGGEQLTAVLAKNESAAAFMADGLARAHNTLGVCCATSGAGMMNLAPGIAEAYADKVPLLAIVGQPPSMLEGKGAFQDSSGKTDTIDALAFWQTITKYSAKITDPKDFWDGLKQALKAIFHKRLGPAVLLIPRDLFDAEVAIRPTDFSIHLDDYRVMDSYDQILMTQFKHVLDKSKNPLVIVGKQFNNPCLQHMIKAFVHAFHCRVVTTFADVNAFSNEDSHYLGMIGICGHHKAHEFLKHEADLIIALDEDFSVMTTTSIAPDLNRIKLCYIGTDANKASAAVKLDIIIEAEVNKVLEALLENHTPATAHYKKTDTRKNKTISSYKNSQASGLTASQTLPVIEKYLSHNENIVFDAGNCVASALHYLHFPSHVKTLIALGMGAMGYAIPAAIGAQMGSAMHSKTMVLTGDGGFLITGLEIHTAIEYQLPILFIVFNNNKHGMCVTRQQLLFSNRLTASTYGTIHIKEVVKGLGDESQLWCETVNNHLDLENSLTDYYENHSNKTGVLEIKITADEVPPFIPFLEQQEKLKQAEITTVSI